MFLGVPYLPFFMVAGGLLLLSMYTNFWFLLTIPVAIFIMRQMAKRDEMIFRLLGLRRFVLCMRGLLLGRLRHRRDGQHAAGGDDQGDQGLAVANSHLGCLLKGGSARSLSPHGTYPATAFLNRFCAAIAANTHG